MVIGLRSHSARCNAGPSRGKVIEVRNPKSTRPWQHVLEPLSGYLLLAETTGKGRDHKSIYADAFNFGPKLEGNQTVKNLVMEEMIQTLEWSMAWTFPIE